MSQITFQAFEAGALARGSDEILERKWAPDSVQGAHTHPFNAEALVVQGEMWLTVDGLVQHLRSGDTFALNANVVHSEKYGSEGATYWVARRNGS
jgi:mannose-6-phosphate isomerase-like protein (cupin superfamily)